MMALESNESHDHTLRPNVLIVGAGIAGCALAASLTRKGLDVLLVEREISPRHRFRGEYMQPFVVQTLARLGFENIVLKNRCTVNELHFRDLESNGRDVLGETSIRYPKTTHAVILPHHEILKRAQERVSDLLHSRFWRGVDLELISGTGSPYERPVFRSKNLSGRSQFIQPQWVVGCDGRQSKVRTKWMNGLVASPLGSAAVGSPHEFIVGCELKSGPMHTGRYEVMRTKKNGTLSAFHLHGHSQRLYWSVPSKIRANRKSDWEREIRTFLNTIDFLRANYSPEFSNVSGAPANTQWLGPAARGRFLLAGDALAITTPFGGQGMTCAMQHVNLLTEFLKENSDSSRHSMDSLGQIYSSECAHWFRHFGILNNAIYYLFFARNDVFRRTTRHVIKAWNGDAELAAYVGELFGGINLSTPNLREIFKLCGGEPLVERALNSINMVS